ncbi:MAG: class I SAM-dependent methyltransferase [Cyanobium sp.]
MGFGLCQLAAAYPEGQFVGVDFNPSHIAQSQTLAKRLGLSNITFVDGDFIDLANSITSCAAPPIQANSFHCVAAHGIYTWVVDHVRDALLQLASRALRAGGIFYCSNNCYPGWLGRSVFQHLLHHEQRRSNPTADKACFQTTIRTCHHLLGTAESPSPLGASLPFLRNDLDHRWMVRRPSPEPPS